ncbi:S8 family serine peptidase [Ancylothrix sp. C2]|uniref:S8 family peptidase n=1 Tax=Ancylothrix sp. D3o TaxID=2953691 RepID=UPI0021BA525C|nr:S8 family serine peptidase [Ancylothrix sp. D3o]MCT7949860.1 S8 family serine peptidase [Ancylothrix sp. D3o]
MAFELDDLNSTSLISNNNLDSESNSLFNLIPPLSGTMTRESPEIYNDKLVPELIVIENLITADITKADCGKIKSEANQSKTQPPALKKQKSAAYDIVTGLPNNSRPQPVAGAVDCPKSHKNQLSNCITGQLEEPAIIKSVEPVSEFTPIIAENSPIEPALIVFETAIEPAPIVSETAIEPAPIVSENPIIETSPIVSETAIIEPAIIVSENVVQSASIIFETEILEPASAIEPTVFELRTPQSLGPVQFSFPRESQPLIGIIDTGFSAHNPDLNYSKIILGSDRIDGDKNPLLQAGKGDEHGTAVLGIIAATKNNGIGIEGINDDAPIWVGRAVGSGKWEESLREFVDTAVASSQPNAIINLSFELTEVNDSYSMSPRFELTAKEKDAIEYARQNNVLIVVAAGNKGKEVSALAGASKEFDNIITVGAVDNWNRADYSNYGEGLSILAEGGTQEKPLFSTVGEGVGKVVGTSTAAATVTGAASLVWAANPELSYQQVKVILLETATDLNTAGWDALTGFGLLNVSSSVEKALQILPENTKLETGFLSNPIETLIPIKNPVSEPTNVSPINNSLISESPLAEVQAVPVSWLEEGGWPTDNSGDSSNSDNSIPIAISVGNSGGFSSNGSTVQVVSPYPAEDTGNWYDESSENSESSSSSDNWHSSGNGYEINSSSQSFNEWNNNSYWDSTWVMYQGSQNSESSYSSNSHYFYPGYSSVSNSSSSSSSNYSWEQKYRWYGYEGYSNSESLWFNDSQSFNKVTSDWYNSFSQSSSYGNGSSKSFSNYNENSSTSYNSSDSYSSNNSQSGITYRDGSSSESISFGSSWSKSEDGWNNSSYWSNSTGSSFGYFWSESIWNGGKSWSWQLNGSDGESGSQNSDYWNRGNNWSLSKYWYQLDNGYRYWSNSWSSYFWDNEQYYSVYESGGGDTNGYSYSSQNVYFSEGYDAGEGDLLEAGFGGEGGSGGGNPYPLNPEVDRAIIEYLNSANGPVGNRNYWKNAVFQQAAAYMDFFTFFVFKFKSEVIPKIDNPGTYTTNLPDETTIIVRPNATSVDAPTVEIQRPTGAPYKIRYLPIGETLP